MKTDTSAVKTRDAALEELLVQMRDDWVRKMHEAHAVGTNGALEKARLTREVHDIFRQYDAWTWLMESDGLPFKPSHADKLVFIGKRLVGMLDPHTCGDLPHQIGALYVLAHLEPAEIRRCVHEGLVRWDTTRAAAIGLVRKLRGEPDKKPQLGFHLVRRLDGLCQSAQEQLDEFSADVLEEALSRAESLADMLRAQLERLKTNPIENLEDGTSTTN